MEASGRRYRSNWAVDTPIPGIIQPYTKNNTIFRDPKGPRGARLTYMYNDLLATARQSDIESVARTVMIMDGANVLINAGHACEPNGTPVDAVVNARGTCDADRVAFVNNEVVTRHSGGANYGFTDGHVRWYKPNVVYFPPRSSASRHYRDTQTGALLGPNPSQNTGAWSPNTREPLTLRYQGKEYVATFHAR